MKDDQRGTDMDLIAVAKHDAIGDGLIGEPHAILATEIVQHRATLADDDARMSPRYARHIEANDRGGVASDDILARSQGDTMSSGHDAATLGGRRGQLAVKPHGGRVTDAVRRSYHGRSGIAIVQRAAQLLDEARQRRVRRECARPQPFVQFVLPQQRITAPSGLAHGARVASKRSAPRSYTHRIDREITP